MLYRIENGAFVPAEDALAAGRGPVLGLCALAQAEAVFAALGLPAVLLDELLAGRAARYESHEGFDLLRLAVLDGKKLALSERPAAIYLDASRLLIFSDSSALRQELDGFVQQAEEPSLDEVLHFLFKQLTMEDSGRLDSMEAAILSLEDHLLEDRQTGGCAREIAALRRRLFTLKSYYEQFYDILDGIMENRNHFFGKDALVRFRIFAGKLDRLGRRTANLRDYTTQVRESYQAQVDIELNKIMKLFTVITAIVAPLTLITGWYGMNFAVPEYSWRFGYLWALGLSVAVVALCTVYFKKHHWF